MPLPDVPEIRETLSLVELSPRKGSADDPAVQIAELPEPSHHSLKKYAARSQA
jgi:hypothetical protein